MVVLTELELFPGSSSSPSSTHDHIRLYDYDVFLSFRGADTRNGFIDHLYNALLDAAINTFLDDEEIETGEPLKPELEGAIQSSRASIIVLSKNYASSTWCLDELVLILDQKRKFNQIVIPIFYHVEPTDIRKQHNSFGEAIAEHKQKMDAETNAQKRSQLAQKMDSWNRALTEVANLKGRDVKNRKETEFIKEVVAEIHRRLRVPLSNTMHPIIGMDYKIEFISSWLTDGSCLTADILAVVGMSGIGKTSLARHVFGLHSSKFDKSSFIDGINTKANEHFDGLLKLQKQLHTDISKKNKVRVNTVIKYTSKIEIVLACKRALIVLDDIGSLKQLDALLGNKGLYPGSKVIITTKDASLTKRCALIKSQVHPSHKEVLLNGLHEDESLELLCIHAFDKHMPKEGYKEVSEKLVKYCDGHPLAIEVLGRSLQDQDVAYWEDRIKVLKKEPHSHINTTLKMSFDSIPYENDRELFKHIACFFVGTDRDVTETILDACGINTKMGIRNLLDKSLLSIGWNNNFEMHSLIQEMGRDLVRKESLKKPWKRSRLWCHEDSFEVLEQKKGTGNLVGLALDMRMLENENVQLETDALSKMDNLKLLQLNYVKINGSYKNVSKELRWLCMHGFPFKSIPSELPVEKLVVLDMSHSNIESFDMSYSIPQRIMSRLKGLIGSSSNGKRLLGSLKILDLSFCKQLHTIGGFFLLPALERLILRNCTSLIEVCESVEQCDELVYIDVSYCYNLIKLPNSLGMLKKVKTVLLDGCNSVESQMEMGNVKAIIPIDLKLFKIQLPSSLRILSLANNNLSNESFPMDLSYLAMLEELCLDNNPIVSMPNCVRTLPRLRKLYLEKCQKLISIEYPPSTLDQLSSYVSFSRFTQRKIKFDLEMSPLKGFSYWNVSSSVLLLEIDGMVKFQGMESVEENVLHSLGWTNLDFIKERHLKISDSLLSNPIECETQMFYEFGIFSTIYEWKEMPEWFRCRRKGPSISFAIPSSLGKLVGLNFCCVETRPFNKLWLPMIKISNITKNHSWIYKHHIEFVELGGNEHHFEDGEEYRLCWLSHWMFGPNEMKAGDIITITVAERFSDKKQSTMECGIGLVYNDGSLEKQGEDVLGYYKSWNYRIGGDLSSFQLTTGEYILHNRGFRRDEPQTYGDYFPFINNGSKFKEVGMSSFKAFSPKNR